MLFECTLPRIFISNGNDIRFTFNYKYFATKIKSINSDKIIDSDYDVTGMEFNKVDMSKFKGITPKYQLIGNEYYVIKIYSPTLFSWRYEWDTITSFYEIVTEKNYWPEAYFYFVEGDTEIEFYNLAGTKYSKSVVANLDSSLTDGEIKGSPDARTRLDVPFTSPIALGYIKLYMLPLTTNTSTSYTLTVAGDGVVGRSYMRFRIKPCCFAQRILFAHVQYILFHIGSRENPVKYLAHKSFINIILSEQKIVKMIQNT